MFIVNARVVVHEIRYHQQGDEHWATSGGHTGTGPTKAEARRSLVADALETLVNQVNVGEFDELTSIVFVDAP